ncbi:MAG: hypothetical protein RCG15_03010 [Candidatus Rickettsia vulgarisii]
MSPVDFHNTTGALTFNSTGAQTFTRAITNQAKATLNAYANLVDFTNIIDPGSNNKGNILVNSGLSGTTLTIENDAVSLGTVANMLQQFSFTGSDDFNIKPTINVTSIVLGAPGSVTTNDVNSNTITYYNNSIWNANGNITGDINFQANDTILNLADGKTIIGKVINSGGSPAGTLNFRGAGVVTDIINNLAAVNFQGAGFVNMESTVNAATLTLEDPGVDVIANDLVTDNLVFASGGNFEANGGFKGKVIFDSLGGGFNLGAGQTLDGLVDNSGSWGTLVLNGGTVTGSVGISNPLVSVVFNTGVTTLNSTLNAQNIFMNQPNADVTVNDLITGKYIIFS